MNDLDVVIVGNGKLANALLLKLPAISKSKDCAGSVINFNDIDTSYSNAVIVHTGSGRQYDESLNWAISNKLPFIQAATEKEIPMKPPQGGEIVYIHAPNLDIHLIKLFHWLKLGADLFKNDSISIKESHQATKKSIPGTAFKICDILGIDKQKIESIRDKVKQQSLNINTINQHAYHQIVIGDKASSIAIETKIEGLEPYVDGLYMIIKAIPALKPMNYEIEDLISNGLN